MMRAKFNIAIMYIPKAFGSAIPLVAGQAPVKQGSVLMPGSKKYFIYSIHIYSFPVSDSVSCQNCNYHSLKNH